MSKSNSATPELSTGSLDIKSPTPAVAEPEGKQRDPSDKEGLLSDKINESPTDILLYFQLIQLYEINESYDKIKSIYDNLNDIFPYYTPIWSLQLLNDLQRDEFDSVEVTLSKCLSGNSNNNDLALWMIYLDYVRRKNNIITGGHEARSVVIKAFELVLEKCAVYEPNSGQFWNDYLNFLENWKPFNKWEEQQKIDMIRKLYKRMLSVPFNNLEQMWGKYTAWEQEINNLTARKFIGELSPDYMKARSLYKEWSNVTKGLKRVAPLNLSTVNRNNIPQPNVPIDAHQLQLWLDWFSWEKENKLVLDESAFNNRRSYVYEQAIQFMVFTPQIWYEYSVYLGTATETEQFLSYGLKANPMSLLLTFKLSESYELANNVDKIKNTYETTINAVMKYYNQLKQQQSSDNIELDEKINHVKEQLTYIYCIYMNTVKRISGLTAARSVFGKCRKLKNNLNHNIYIENAYLEFQNQNDYKTACKVLELGLKYFHSDGIYINKYIDFLIMINKSSQIQTLFETSIEKITDLGHLKVLFKKMISYEAKFGNLNNAASLIKRFTEKFPNESSIDIFTDRYQIQRENLIKKLELTYLYEPRASALYNLTNIPDRYIGNEQSSVKRALENTYYEEPNKRQNQGNSNIPQEIVDLLRILPKRQYFKNALLDPNNLVNYLTDQVEITANQNNN
ncbi:hypothetical protein KAFR_0A00350 [Kazachstania africana CBS 2517]|uniref:mRNA 3'-end-processing protein RNA14 n=1 Tax=Kazachstania africana (strain ATCC 22294 / BCRC 22015 / CBS 2517 / CECT 1963 / NBRC 1671 / NRRL Y-8276) TaxID=1071382 RepID=H2AM73_KAZAF|nr:hypothetical protein KAFR_0A00350 [Kazachstania africana CBS 2517]CCF55473.1 hypothetical protein KAFR_0A00350 [Kazachstania africana CBS 2517]